MPNLWQVEMAQYMVAYYITKYAYTDHFPTAVFTQPKEKRHK